MIRAVLGFRDSFPVGLSPFCAFCPWFLLLRRFLNRPQHMHRLPSSLMGSNASTVIGCHRTSAHRTRHLKRAAAITSQKDCLYKSTPHNLSSPTRCAASLLGAGMSAASSPARRAVRAGRGGLEEVQDIVDGPRVLLVRYACALPVRANSREAAGLEGGSNHVLSQQLVGAAAFKQTQHTQIHNTYRDTARRPPLRCLKRRASTDR